MNQTILTTLFVAFAMVCSGTLLAQKKLQTFQVSKVINLPADQIWQVVGVDYGAVANSHPKIISSEYIGGSLAAGEGAQRICRFNDSGSKYLEEVMQEYDPANMTFVNVVTQAGKFPMDPSVTRATYTIKDLGNGTCEFSFNMQFRTKPAFMGGMAKGQFKSLIQDYFISVEHYARTGEPVNKENFKEIKKKYS